MLEFHWGKNSFSALSGTYVVGVERKFSSFYDHNSRAKFTCLLHYGLMDDSSVSFWTRIFYIFGQIFAIFDDFSKCRN